MKNIEDPYISSYSEYLDNELAKYDIKLKEVDREKIRKDIEEFLKSGKKIKIIPTGFSSNIEK